MTAYPVLILAGGLATRLRPHTETVPKALIDVNGAPFIAHQLRLLARSGIRRVVVCAGWLGERIRDFVGDGSRFGLDVAFSFDGPVLLGTAGAIRRALPLAGPRFLVLYGDSYLQCDYGAVARAFDDSGRAALMTVYRNEGRYDASNVAFSGGLIRAYDKRSRTPDMRYIDYGLGAFTAAPFERILDGEPRDLARVYGDLLAANDLAGFEVATRFYEIGSPAGLEEFRRHMSGSEDLRMNFIHDYLSETVRIAEALDRTAIESVVRLLAAARDRGGRLFLLGVGGSAANASHAVNDFRKLAGFEAYAPTDNVSELTARTNDEGWASVFAAWLRVSRLSDRDVVLVLSVGGGSLAQNVSPNLVAALDYARSAGAGIAGIVGRDGGHTAAVADACIVVPTVNPAHVTPHTEAFQSVILHLLVTHPGLKAAPTKWESL